VGAASGGDGRGLAVREGGTRRHGVRGGDGSSEGNRGQRYTVARWRWNKVAQWGRWAGGRKAVHGWWGGWAPFIAGRGGGRRRRGGESGGGETAAGNQRRRWCHCSDRLPTVCVSRQQLSSRWARGILTGWAGTADMGWVQSGAQPFFQLFKLCSKFEVQNEDHPDVHKCSNLAWC
jgi:hypothetical protein